MAGPESSIDWKRRFTLPLALPLNLGDSPPQKITEYFDNCGIGLSFTSYADATFVPDSPRKLRQVSGPPTLLLPRTSRARAGAAVTPVEVGANAIRNALRTTQYQGDLPDDLAAAIDAESQAVQVFFEDYRSELSPLPFVPAQSLWVTWTPPPQPPVHQEQPFEGVAPDMTQGLVFPAAPKYLYATGPAALGELDPLWMRAAIPGLVRFQRYRHLRRTGAGVRGHHPGTSGRLVVWDPDPSHLIDDGGADNRLSRAMTALAYEQIDAGYEIAGAIGLTLDVTQITRKPALAESFKALLILYLSHFVRFRDTTASRTPPTPQTDIPPLLFKMVGRILTRLFRAWIAHAEFVLQPAWAPAFPDAALLAALRSDNEPGEGALADIAAFLTTNLAHWQVLMAFVDAVFVPLMLGASWRTLGVPAASLPARLRGNGWWRANPWAWRALNGLEAAAQNWLVVYAGCPLGQPAGFYRAAEIEAPEAADDDERLQKGEGLSAHEVETLTLADAAQAALRLPAAPAKPASLASPVDLDQFAGQSIGAAAVLRAYNVIVGADASIEVVSLPMNDFLGVLLQGANVADPILDLGQAPFDAHPVATAGLVVVSGDFTIRSLRDDGAVDSLTLGDVIEYRVRHGGIVGGTPATLARLHLKITLKAPDDTLQPYLHLRGNAVAADPTFQTGTAGLVEAQDLPSGWTANEAIEVHLAQHALDYERLLLVLHDAERNETTFCAWHRSVARADGKTGDQDVQYAFMADAQVLAQGDAGAKLKLPVAAPPAQPFPAMFQMQVVTSLRLPRNSDIFRRNAGDELTARLAYLDRQLVTRAEDGLVLLNAYRANAGTEAQRSAIDTAWRAEVTAAGDLRPNAVGDARTGYETLFFKLVEQESRNGFDRGIVPEFVRANFHKRIRIVHRAYADYAAELAAAGLAHAQLPVAAMWALYRAEGALNVPPAFEMLQRGIPPLRRAPQNILIFPRPRVIGGVPVDLGELMIGDLIARDQSGLVSAGVIAAGRHLFADVRSNSPKSEIDRARQWCLPHYHINLLSMDIYIDRRLDPFNERASRYAFVKTYLLTRMAMGQALTEALARQAVAAWYRMAGLLVSCRRGEAFVVVRDSVEMAAFWVREAVMHLTMLRVRPAITGHVLANRLPVRLAYLRFNFGDVSFWRIVNIVVMQALRHAGAMPLANFSASMRAFVEHVRDDLTGNLGAAAITPLQEVADMIGQFPGDLDRREQDTRSDLATFQTVEDRLLARAAPTAAELAALRGVLPGTREGDILADVTAQTGGRFAALDALIAWLDATNEWPALDEFFASQELDTRLIAFIQRGDSREWRRENLFRYEASRRYGHYVRGFARIFA